MRILLYILIVMSVSVQAQQLAPVASTPLEADTFVGIDTYKNTYFIRDFELYKEGPLGNYVFKDFQLGPIASVDIINPLNVVVFYQEVNTVVFLDNRLNEIERINFNIIPEFINVGMATNAGNNRLWLFNIDTQQLELYNYRNQRQTIVSQPFNGQLLAQASNFNYCYVLTESALYAFNIYGSPLWKEAADGVTQVVQHNNSILLEQNNELYYYVEKDKDPLKITTPELSIKNIQLTQDFLYIYDGENVHTFTLTQPKQ